MRNYLTSLPEEVVKAFKGVESLLKNSWFRLFMPVLMVVLLLMPGGARTVVDMMKPHHKGQE